MKEHIFPRRIVEISCREGVENLLKRQTLQIGLAEQATTLFAGGDYVILDFGAEICGGLRILSAGYGPSRIRLRFGESLSECCANLGGEKNATNDHALRDMILDLPGLSDQVLGDTGFRFVRVDFLREARIKCMAAVNHILKKRPITAYTGSDPLIAGIWQTAKRTVDLCASRGYVWDGIKRDRLVWIGDMHPEMLALTTLYGRLPVIEKSLDFVRAQTPLPGWMNGYPMYSMWWVIILADYCCLAGAGDYVKKQIPYLQDLVHQLNGCVREDGSLDYPSYFVDWPTHDTPDEIHGVRAINILAARKAGELLRAFGADPGAAEDMLEKLLRIPITPQKSKQVLGLKYLAVGLTEADKEKLTAGGAAGMSTFMSYYILKAVASFDRDAAIAMMKDYYGAMLAKGATTFWEDFDLAWAEKSCPIDRFPREGERDLHGDFGAFCYVGFRHSLCHGWSAGVLRFIAEECG